MQHEYILDIMTQMRDKEKQVLFELLKDGRKPDKHIAQLLRLTQPTVTRIRQRLERDKIIRGYRAVIDEKAANLSISAITFFDWRDHSEKQQTEEATAYINKMPEVVYFAQGEGLRGKTLVMMTFHKTFSGYEEFTKKLRERYGKQLAYIEEFISSMDSIHKRDPTNALIHAMAD